MGNADSTTPRSVPAPNYTQAPNFFFDHIMPYVSSTAELKVTLAIIRQTFGYHKEEDRLSLSRLEELTGLSRKSVAEGIKLALKRGYVGRRKAGDSYIYGLRVGSEESTPPPRMASEESTPVGSEESTPTKENNKRKNTSKDVDGSPSPGIFVGYLREELDGADVPLLRNREERYAGEFNKLIKKGIGTDVLYKVCDRIAERWRDDEHRKLTAEQALEDVVNGKPPANVTELPEWKRGTPAEVIDYVFANARSSYIRNCERRLRSTMARFDFTSSEQPPWKIEKELGGTDNERWSTLDALHSLCRRAEREMGASA